jgi:hypothetical protein
VDGTLWVVVVVVDCVLSCVSTGSEKTSAKIAVRLTRTSFLLCVILMLLVNGLQSSMSMGPDRSQLPRLKIMMRFFDRVMGGEATAQESHQSIDSCGADLTSARLGGPL